MSPAPHPAAAGSSVFRLFETPTRSSLHSAVGVWLCRAVGVNRTIVRLVPQTLTDVEAGFDLDLSQTGCLEGIAITQTNANHPNAPVAVQTGHYWTITPSRRLYVRVRGFLDPADVFHAHRQRRCLPLHGHRYDPAVRAERVPSTVSRWRVSQFSDWAVGSNPPTSAMITNFVATRQSASIRLTGRTTSEIHLSGFHVYRARRSSGPWARLNRVRIRAVAPGRSGGSHYEWVDRTANRRTPYWYRLAAIDLAAAEMRLGKTQAPRTLR